MSDSTAIPMENVIDLVPEKNGVIYRVAGPKHVDMMILKEKDFFMFKFEAIKWIKQMEDPDDRIWPFEVRNIHDCYCYDKERSLVDARKSRSEKEKELKDEKELKELYRAHGICL